MSKQRHESISLQAIFSVDPITRPPDRQITPIFVCVLEPALSRIGASVIVSFPIPAIPAPSTPPRFITIHHNPSRPHHNVITAVMTGPIPIDPEFSRIDPKPEVGSASRMYNPRAKH